MHRIFLTLASLAVAFLGISMVLGLNIGDPRSLESETQKQISTHMLVGLAGLTFATLVHAISLTYFMGTGRWIEETSNAYGLGDSLYSKSQKTKYRTLPGMVLCILLLIATGALGAVADPATPVSLDGTFGTTGAQIHLFVAILTVIVNFLTNFSQFVAISKNARVVEEVLMEVRSIRMERGLPV